MLAVEMAAVSDRGRVRPHNEDAVAIQAQSRFAILADGLGGHEAGEVASRLAVDVVGATLSSALAHDAAERFHEADAVELVRRAIAAANGEIYEAAHAEHAHAGMGTTVVVAVWLANYVVAGHVGDSRLYRMRAGRIAQLTRDHSLIQENVDRGVRVATAAEYATARGVVTRAVGLEPTVEADVNCFDTADGDVYVLCSDGLTDMVTDRDIERALSAAVPRLDRACDALITAANANGGRDNISVIVVRVREANAPS